MFIKVLSFSLLTILLLCTNSNPQIEPGDLDSIIYRTETIEVDALRGIDRLTPITFQDIKRPAIEEKYWMQDLPIFLKGNNYMREYYYKHRLFRIHEITFYFKTLWTKITYSTNMQINMMHGFLIT